MFPKIILLSFVLAVAVAQNQHQYNNHNNGQDHGHAYSSQSIVVHHPQVHKQAPAHYQEVHGHQEQHTGQQVVSSGHNNQHYSGLSEYHTQGGQEHHGHASSAQTIQQHHDGHKAEHVEYYGHPKYEFAYEVHDPHTHDIKSQHEHRDGDVVKGEYSLHQPDGVVRTVKYHADKKSGFNAQVNYDGHAKHVVPEHHNHH